MEELLAFIVECIGEHDLSMCGCGAHARDQAAARQQCEGGDHYSGVATACHQSYGPPASWSSAASQPHQPQSGPEQRAADTVAGADTVASSRAGLGVCSVECNYINQMLSPAAPSPLSARLSRCLSTAPVHIFVMLLSRRWTLNFCNISEKIVPRQVTESSWWRRGWWCRHPQ